MPFLCKFFLKAESSFEIFPCCFYHFFHLVFFVLLSVYQSVCPKERNFNCSGLKIVVALGMPLFTPVSMNECLTLKILFACSSLCLSMRSVSTPVHFCASPLPSSAFKKKISPSRLFVRFVKKSFQEYVSFAQRRLFPRRVFCCFSSLSEIGNFLLLLLGRIECSITLSHMDVLL